MRADNLAANNNQQLVKEGEIGAHTLRINSYITVLTGNYYEFEPPLVWDLNPPFSFAFLRIISINCFPKNDLKKIAFRRAVTFSLYLARAQFSNPSGVVIFFIQSSSETSRKRVGYFQVVPCELYHTYEPVHYIASYISRAVWHAPFNPWNKGMPILWVVG